MLFMLNDFSLYDSWFSANKSLFLQMTLIFGLEYNVYNKILVVDIPTQILLSIIVVHWTLSFG